MPHYHYFFGALDSVRQIHSVRGVGDKLGTKLST